MKHACCKKARVTIISGSLALLIVALLGGCAAAGFIGEIESVANVIAALGNVDPIWWYIFGVTVFILGVMLTVILPWVVLAYALVKIIDITDIFKSIMDRGNRE